MTKDATTPIEQFLASTRISDLSSDSRVDERVEIVREIASRIQDAEPDEVFRAGVREEVISALKSAGVTGAARLFDSALQSARRVGAASSMSIIPPDPEPWPEMVEGSELLREVEQYIARYLVLPADAAIVLAAWAMATWCVGHVVIAPILAFLSPTKQSGKTLALAILRRLVMRPLSITDVTTAGTFRVMHEYRPTLLWDEAECLGQKGNGQQISIMNAGYQRGTPVFRCVGDDNTPEAFDPFGFRAVGAIGTLASTLLDRSIVIPMKRAPKRHDGDSIFLTDEQGARKAAFNDYTADEDTLDLRRRIARWARDNGPEVGRASAAPERMQSWLGFRGSRNWAVLFEIGRRCGGESQEALIEASRELATMSRLADGDERERLVHDVADVFAETGAVELSSADLARKLAGQEDSPWCEYSGGRALTPHKLSLLLRPFGIAPTQFRSPRAGKIRGYTRHQFNPVFQAFGISAEETH